MSITLHKVVPTYLEPDKTSHSQIWLNDFEINEGEKIQIIAPSGSGKTSLVHFLYGLRNEFNGTIQYQNKDIKKFTAQQWANLRASEISIVFQDLRLFENHTVAENLNVKRNLNPFHSTSQIAQMAEQLGIANKLNQLASKCSYGEQQRVAIIRALQQPFKYLIMDEPFSHLDEANSKIALQLIEQEAEQRGATIVLADLEKISFFNATKTIHL
jgi:ABC-type lipoprotein export system ATPase subunit